jgi:hypothetical protein
VTDETRANNAEPFNTSGNNPIDERDRLDAMRREQGPYMVPEHPDVQQPSRAEEWAAKTAPYAGSPVEQTPDMVAYDRTQDRVRRRQRGESLPD